MYFWIELSFCEVPEIGSLSPSRTSLIILIPPPHQTAVYAGDLACPQAGRE